MNYRRILEKIPAIALAVAGAIHLLPVPGALGGEAIARLYGIAVDDPNTAILLQHRALLFGALGVFMLSAIRWPQLRWAAMSVGLFSAASFIAVAGSVGGYNDAIARVVVADAVASAALVCGLAAHWRTRAQPQG